MRKFSDNLDGFTLIEVLITMGIVIILAGIMTINLINVEPRANLNSEVTEVIADVKNQQLKALTGLTFNGETADYGVHFEEESYTLFAGSVYVPSETSNSKVDLKSGNLFSSVTFPSATVVFKKENGEIDNFSPSFSSITLKNSVTKSEKTITFNRLGVVVAVN